MLTLVGGQVESLWDEVLPVEVRELPEDLARLDRVLSDLCRYRDYADMLATAERNVLMCLGFRSIVSAGLSA